MMSAESSGRGWDGWPKYHPLPDLILCLVKPSFSIGIRRSLVGIGMQSMEDTLKVVGGPVAWI